ncbi:armadillo repeat-containing protein 7-like isoform X2 [Leptotrombidium deliense]|uniref:Armadillo repeat-containing protein 7-like isoform X2 n=1 Tax=Leptotrombidium deliense TaxID=299467 RepID=A0A443S6H2_9ACAR|nr:armadillo repeat-containing protein 7-like isoform X2 [Leptotrombidium deliense]
MKRHHRHYDSADRFQYLKELLHEFQVSQNQDAKRQVLANLANFCYDPINFEHIRKLNLICIFLDLLSVKNKKFVEFSISGLCNLSVDPKNVEVIINYNGLEKICTCIGNENNEIKLSALTTLIHITNKDNNAINGNYFISCFLYLKHAFKQLSTRI